MGCPLSTDPTILNKYPHDSMMDFFRFFDGLPDRTVSQAIDVILVPNRALRERVTDFVSRNPQRFRATGPAIRIFGKPSLRVWGKRVWNALTDRD
jgi:hypothetical protein